MKGVVYVASYFWGNFAITQFKGHLCYQYLESLGSGISFKRTHLEVLLCNVLCANRYPPFSLYGGLLEEIHKQLVHCLTISDITCHDCQSFTFMCP